MKVPYLLILLIYPVCLNAGYSSFPGISDTLALNPHFHLSYCITQYDKTYFNQVLNTVHGDLKENHKSRVIKTKETTWQIYSDFEKVIGNSGVYDITVRFVIRDGVSPQTVPAVEFTFDNWNEENYLLMPGEAYNGNRFESRKIAYSPKLCDFRDIGMDKPQIISDVPRLNNRPGPSFIQARSGDMAVPSAGFYVPADSSGFWMITSQGDSRGDFGITFLEDCTRNSAKLKITSPVTRELYSYHICDNNYPSPDRATDLTKGDSIVVSARIYFFRATDLQALFNKYLEIRHDISGRNLPPTSFPLSHCFEVQQEKFNAYNWVKTPGYYSVGMRENFLQDWQIGWTGGMISTYPLLFNGDSLTVNRVLKMFDWLFPDGIAPSGFFWDSGESSDGRMQWYGGDIRRPLTSNWHLVRKSGDGLFYVIKQLMLIQKMGIKPGPAWEEGAKTVADAFVNLWMNNKQLGQFIDSRTGEIIVGGSISGAIVPAALLLAGKYFGNQHYEEVAIEIADYFYKNYISKGISCGGPGDALQCPDSESSYAMLESFTRLYDTTHDRKWRVRAEDMAAQFSTWVIGYNYHFPEGSELQKAGIQTTGAVFANVQNKHGAPGICTYSGMALLRLYRQTGQRKYLDLLQEITRFIPQNLSMAEHPLGGLPIGWMSERVSTTDWYEGIGEIMHGSTWAETSLMLTYTEIPGIYIFPERDLAVAFDQLAIKTLDVNPRFLRLEVSNPGKSQAVIRLFVDSEKQVNDILNENYLLHCRTLMLKPGETKILKFTKS